MQLLSLLACLRPSEPVARTNVVLLVGCTVRQDQVGVYGGPAGLTPFLDSIAEQGLRFADPIAAAPWTKAAGTAIFTGHHAVDVGMVEPGPELNRQVLDDQVVTLAERFRSAGYRTVGGTSNPNLHSKWGFGQGYEHVVEPRQLWAEDRGKWPASMFVPELLQAVPDASSTPLFLGAMLVDAHAPFHAAGEPWQQYREQGLPDEVARYRFALHGLDAGLASLVQGLESKGYTADNTLLVVVSDHGEGLSWPEHHGRSHGRYLYGSAAQMVWLMRGPEVPNQVREGVVSQIDVAPTVLAWAGVEAELPGADVLSGEGAGVAFTDTWFRDESRTAVWTDERVCMKDYGSGSGAPTGRFVEGCYDRKDRLQTTPLPLEAEVIDQWRRAHPVRGGQRDEGTELDAQLRELGYLESP